MSFRIGSFLLTLGLTMAQAGAAVVYDNTTVANLKSSAFSTSQEYGDEIKLAGTERFVTQFVVGYFGDFPEGTSAWGTFRIYANDGSDALTGPQVAMRPKTLIWESAPFSLSPNNQEAVFTPNVTVPETFTWTVKFEGLSFGSGSSAALSVVTPVTVGGALSGGRIGSYNDFWLKTGDTSESWSLNLLSGGSIPANFYAKVTAVPESVTVPPRLEWTIPSGAAPQLKAFGTSGAQYRLEVSPDFQTWVTSGAGTITTAGEYTSKDVILNEPLGDTRFFRLVPLP